MGLLALYSALASGRMGIAAPVSGVVGAVVPVLVGAAAARVARPASGIAGFALALVGVWLLTAAGGGVERRDRARSSCCRSWPGVSFGLFLVFIHRAGRHGRAVAADRRAATSLGVLTAIGGVTGTLRLPRRVRRSGSQCLAGVLDTGGNAFFVLAAQAGRLDVAGVLSSLYPAATVALACLLLRERLTRRQAVGAAATLAAIGCVSS